MTEQKKRIQKIMHEISINFDEFFTPTNSHFHKSLFYVFAKEMDDINVKWIKYFYYLAIDSHVFNGKVIDNTHIHVQSGF